MTALLGGRCPRAAAGDGPAAGIDHLFTTHALHQHLDWIAARPARRSVHPKGISRGSKRMVMPESADGVAVNQTWSIVSRSSGVGSSRKFEERPLRGL